MNRRCAYYSIFLLACQLWTAGACRALAFEAEDYEEPAGLCFAVYGNPAVGAWSFGFEDGTRLVNTPIMGQAFLTVLRLERSAAWYGGIGMTLRLMPQWRLAPFVGGGGGYYHTSANEESAVRPSDPNDIPAESFWGGIVEGGVRADLPGRSHFFDFSVRHVWNSSNSRLNFVAAGIAYGRRW